MDTHLRTLSLAAEDHRIVNIIDQRLLPHELVIRELRSYRDASEAIKSMTVRGAPLIGITAAYGIYLACLEAPDDSDAGFDAFLREAGTELRSARPTAANLAWAVDRQLEKIRYGTDPQAKIKLALEGANQMRADDIESCRLIGVHTLPIIERIYQRKQLTDPQARVNILTHCNAGWLGCIDWGTATSGIYQAHEAGIPVHVWVDETRPRNQGFNLTSWELSQRGVDHTCIVDNAGGHLMQHGMVDMCIVGADRATRRGDVANKIGTYLKALAAHDNQIPFYACVPGSTFDLSISDGLSEIEIEERSPDEVRFIQGYNIDHSMVSVLLMPATAKASNYGFDVTPARLITGIISEHGLCEANEAGIMGMMGK